MISPLRSSRFLRLAALSVLLAAGSAPGEDDAPAPKHTRSAAAKKSPASEDDDAPKPGKAKHPHPDAAATPAAKKKRPPAAADDDAEAPPKKTEEKAKPAVTKPAPRKAEVEEAAPSPSPARPAQKVYGPAATLEPSALAEFSGLTPRLQKLLTSALALTELNLTYTYGSADPASGGMDCSGAIYYLLRQNGIVDPPRDSSGQYAWVRKAGHFFAVVSTQADSFEFSDLCPGDLLFWTGTYDTQREIPISHVMLYLGREKKTHQRVMTGSSDGRSYAGVARWGVSVFDFKMPPHGDAEHPEKNKVRFVGYGRIPGLAEEVTPSPAPAAEEKPKSAAAAAPDESATVPEHRPAATPKPNPAHAKKKRSAPEL